MTQLCVPVCRRWRADIRAEPFAVPPTTTLPEHCAIVAAGGGVVVLRLIVSYDLAKAQSNSNGRLIIGTKRCAQNVYVRNQKEQRNCALTITIRTSFHAFMHS